VRSLLKRNRGTKEDPSVYRLRTSPPRSREETLVVAAIPRDERCEEFGAPAGAALDDGCVEVALCLEIFVQDGFAGIGGEASNGHAANSSSVHY
jgi:hypothetical protein